MPMPRALHAVHPTAVPVGPMPGCSSCAWPPLKAQVTCTPGGNAEGAQLGPRRCGCSAVHFVIGQHAAVDALHMAHTPGAPSLTPSPTPGQQRTRNGD